MIRLLRHGGFSYASTKGNSTMSTARLARALLAAAAAAALVFLGGAPARAQAQPTLGAFLEDVTVPTTGAGSIRSVILFASEPVRLDHLVITYDFTDIAGFATVAKSGFSSANCSTSASVLTCSYTFPLQIGTVSGIGSAVVVAPTPAATLGQEGTLRVTVAADGLAPASHDARVRTGTPVNLTGGPPAEKEAAFGTSFTHSVQVSNFGTNPVNGVVLMFDNDPAFRAGTKFANCTYLGDRPRTCRFDQVLNPGTTWEATVPYVVGADTLAPSHQFAEYQWLTVADYEDLLGQLDALGVEPDEPGSGGTLSLTEVVMMGAQSVDTDTEPNNNWTSLMLSVTGNNDTDLSAVGARLTGAVGDQVVAEVGMRNNGPASIDRGRIGSPAARAHVTIPPGTTAVDVPAQCLPEADNGQVEYQKAGEPGHPKYFCLGDSFFLAAGTTVTFPITLRIDTATPDATGKVSILEPCQCDDVPLSMDRDHTNNTADIVVNPTTANGSALPNTGNRVGLVVGLGGLLLVLGVGTIYVAKRRRLPFAR
jgi:LPXTG-motif cell wall-anchored protein